jgi:outer membrane receptor protein involved in Fe transport
MTVTSPALRLSSVLASACVAVLSAANAMAADSGPTASLDEIVVTATRHEEALSKVPVSLTAMTSEGLDLRGIKDIEDVARFTPGIHVDTSGTANISIRGIASSGGAGTTGIYVDDTPIQMRSIAFNPDESLPKSFDLERVEVLRGPQGTLFGAGSEGGTVRYITVQPSLTKMSQNGRAEVSFNPGGDPSYEAGYAIGGPIKDGTLGARLTVWHRQDGGWIDRVDSYHPSNVVDHNANRASTTLLRLAAIWAPNDTWTVTPSFYYQDRNVNDVGNYWPLYSNPSSHKFVGANPTGRSSPDKFYLPALKVEADLGSVRLISNTSYYHRDEVTGYDGTLYNLGFYQSLLGLGADSLLLDQNGIHSLVPGLEYRAPATINNGQRNFVQELRLQSNDPSSKLFWTAGVFYGSNRQDYLEQLHDPQLGEFFAAAGYPNVADYFGVGLGSNPAPCVPTPTPHCGEVVTGIDPQSSYFLRTHAKDEQTAIYGEATYALTDELKVIAGGRFAKVKFSVDTVTGAAQLFDYDTYLTNSHSESVFTPKLGLSYQHDPNNLYYVTYSKGFRPGGANNPVPQAACAGDFANFGISSSPSTYDSDTVQSYEVGTKNNFDNRLRIASSVYYIKWHNIQQTVLPPVCQISWIQNLGEAVAKGADIQAELAVTPSFTAEFSAGYTDSRYARSSFVGSNHVDVLPVAANGNAIVGQGGQPGAPVTASLGLEYKFEAFGHESFVRGDWEYQGKAKWASPGQDPGSLQYDDANYTLPATNFVTARFGVQAGDWQIALFIDNLMDSRTVTNYNWTINPGVAPDGVNSSSTRLERDWTYRPRTIGVTFTYRH